MLKKNLVSLFLCGTMFVIGACAPESTTATSEPTLDTPNSRISYTLGVSIGRDIASQDMELDQTALFAGIKDSLDGNETRLTQEEMDAEIAAFQEERKQLQEAKAKEAAEKNKAASEAFLEENAKKEGVEVTESGLQYRVIEPGDGNSPTVDSVVTVHYVGKLVDGTEFDSSYSRNEPATFPVAGVIPGWKEALPMMKVGSKWELVIPSDLAYGPSGAGPVIGPYSALVFEVELISIKDK